MICSAEEFKRERKGEFMKTTSTRSSFYLKAAFFILLTLSTATFLQAQTITFAQFFERNGTQDFVFTNNTTSATFQTVPNGSAVYFVFQNIANLPAELQGPQLAHLYVTANTTTPAIQVAGDPPRDIQRFSGTFTIQIIRDSPCNCGTGSQRNLLTAVITPDGTTQSSLAGDDLSDAAAYTASDVRQTVVYTSDFLGFIPNSTDNLGIAFSSLNPNLSIGAGGFLNSFATAGSGSFASNNAPVYSPPTAAGITISGRVLNSYGRGVSGATLTLNDSSGEIRTVRTNSLGYFQFTDIPAGQIVTIGVSAKGLTYASQVFNVTDNIDEVNFYPEQQ
jgi:hypothetical protein